jgi:hypothetical protein
VSDSQLFEDDLLERVREVAPLVPADVLSSTGPSAQRVLTHVLATPARADAAGPTRPPAGRPAGAARQSTWLTRWRVGAVAGLATAIAVVVAILVIGASGGPSIVARAYAATNPAGVIVHYIETSRSSLQANTQVPYITEFWVDGPDSHQILEANNPKKRQDIVTSGGQGYTLAFGTLAIIPAWPANTRCAAAIVLEGGCAEGQNNTPIDGLRSLYRSGQIHTNGHATINGRRVDVLTGSTANLQLRALVDAHTFLPVKVTMIETFPQGRGRRPITYALTITDYQRLPTTPHNRQLLQLPPHPNVRVIRFRPCPTRTDPRKLCRSRAR